MKFPKLRIGEGWDVHALVPGRQLILGGVTIAHETGLLGHSDADVLVHALIDALLGAAALGDIGAHFPDTDPKFRGADSLQLLAHVAQLLGERGLVIGNIDSTIIAQSPKLQAHIPLMRSNLSRVLGLEIGQVNVKAKTAERLGPVGQGLSMEARVVVLLGDTQA